MSETQSEPYKIGIIVGGGSGPVLADVFITFLKKVGKKYGLDFEFYVNSTKKTNIIEVYNKEAGMKIYEFDKNNIEYPYFSTHKHKYKNVKDIEDDLTRTKKEAKAIIELINAWEKIGIKYIFRTALNAEVLYYLRKELKAIKLFEMKINSHNLMVFRDEFQGFYAIDNWQINENHEKITFESHFEKNTFQKFIKFCKKQAEKKYGKDNFETIIIYKHHLFNGYIENWAEDIFNKNNKTCIYQPDTGFSKLLNLLKKEEKKYILLITANEIGDFIHETLLSITGELRKKLLFFTRNYYKGQDFVVYQTVHGSADDKQGKVLPIATIRIAAHILREILQQNDIMKKTDDKTIDWYINESNIIKQSLEKQNFNPFKILRKFIN